MLLNGVMIMADTSDSMSRIMHEAIAASERIWEYYARNGNDKLTENGYTQEFEEEILAEAERCYAAVADGTAKLYNNTAEMFAEWDKEDDD